MRRRKFITLLGGAAAALPLAARAQQGAMPVIGWLNSGWPDQYADRLRAFRQGLSETGHVEGRSMAIEYRWAEDQYDRLPELAADLVRRRVAVIATHSPIVAQAAKGVTTTIPIVFSIGSDPVRDGLVASLNRPGGNLTGITYLGVELGPKVLELLHEAAPTPKVGLLINPDNPTLAEPIARDLQAAAHTLGVELHVLTARTERDFDPAFAALSELRVGALVIGPDPLFGSRTERLATLTLRHTLPAIYLDRLFAMAGGLMSYGGSLTNAWYLAGGYAGRILNGDKPADLPVQQSTKIEFVINLKTAKALGITVPQLLLGRADEIIE
jgi:putative ABC transport system substrate-binding protein